MKGEEKKRGRENGERLGERLQKKRDPECEMRLWRDRELVGEVDLREELTTLLLEGVR